jgi:hypothetical protein
MIVVKVSVFILEYLARAHTIKTFNRNSTISINININMI